MKYRLEVQARHSYNLLIIFEDVPYENAEGTIRTSEEVVGSLKFLNDDLGNKALELWKQVISRIEAEMSGNV